MGADQTIHRNTSATASFSEADEVELFYLIRLFVLMVVIHLSFFSDLWERENGQSLKAFSLPTRMEEELSYNHTNLPGLQLSPPKVGQTDDPITALTLRELKLEFSFEDRPKLTSDELRTEFECECKSTVYYSNPASNITLFSRILH